jgi:hypothetical protein
MIIMMAILYCQVDPPAAMRAEGNLRCSRGGLKRSRPRAFGRRERGVGWGPVSLLLASVDGRAMDKGLSVRHR